MFMSKSKYPVTWRIPFIHIKQMLDLRQIQLLAFVDQVEPQVLVTCNINPLSLKGDQRQISPCTDHCFIKHSGHENRGHDHTRWI